MRPTIVLQNQVLVRRDGDAVQLVVPQSRRHQLFTHTHAGPLAAHLGSQRMLAQLRRLYYWPGMRKDIDAWCRQCEGCAISRSRQVDIMVTFARSLPVHRWTSSPSTSCPAYLPPRMATNTSLSPLTTSLIGSRQYLCATQRHTRACAHFIVWATSPITQRPRSNFESKLVAELCSIAGINKTRTTPFHPRSDGKTERANRTILQMLRASIDAQPESWPDRLPALLAAYRMTPHSVTGISPKMAMMGREVLLPASIIVQPPEEPVVVSTSFAAEFRQNMRNAHASVRSATSRAAKTQKHYFDKHVKGPPFALNQLVWLYWPRPLLRTTSRKLTRSWTGPWRIVEFKTTIVVVV